MIAVPETTTGGELLWPEDVAALLNISTDTVARMLTTARRAAEAGTTAAKHLPLPADTQRRRTWNGHHYVTVTSPRWRRNDITVFIANRPGRGAQAPAGDGRSRSRRTAQT